MKNKRLENKERILRNWALFGAFGDWVQMKLRGQCQENFLRHSDREQSSYANEGPAPCPYTCNVDSNK